MPLHNKIFSIIQPSANADLTGFTYGAVYASTAATPTINGTSIDMPAGTTIDILVRSISSTANVFVIGDKKDTTAQDLNLGSITL